MDNAYKPVDPQLGYCVRCGTPRNPRDLHNCPACGDTDWDPFTVTPLVVPGDTRFSLPPPYDGTKGEWGRAFGLRGPKGVGKSTLMAELCRLGFPSDEHPEWGGGAWWITGEESANQVKIRNKRIGLGTVTVHHLDPHRPHLGMNAFYSKVAGNPPKVVVLDSASILGPIEGLRVCERLKMWAQINQAIVGIIVQLNKAGEAAGFEALGHLLDAWGFVKTGRSGIRTIGLDKNRFGELFNKHWRFSPAGEIAGVSFEHRVLTVTGEPGSYELLPYPLNDKKKMHEFWKYLGDLIGNEVGVLPDYLGYATAGIRAPFLPCGFEIPDDWPDRKRYVELHGVQWLDPTSLPRQRDLRARANEIARDRQEEQDDD